MRTYPADTERDLKRFSGAVDLFLAVPCSRSGSAVAPQAALAQAAVSTSAGLTEVGWKVVFGAGARSELHVGSAVHRGAAASTRRLPLGGALTLTVVVIGIITRINPGCRCCCRFARQADLLVG